MPGSKQDTIKKVTVLGGIVSQEKFAYAMGDLAEAENSGTPGFEAAIKDPKSFLEGKGIRLPAEATVKITKNSPVTVQVCVNSHCIQISINVV